MFLNEKNRKKYPFHNEREYCKGLDKKGQAGKRQIGMKE